MKLQESGENYLETILILQQKNGYVRSIDIATQLDYSKASISRAMGILKKAGLIEMEHGGQIVLTPKGRERAEQIYDRHLIISQYLTSVLGVDAEIAAQDACRIEHVISQHSFDKIKQAIRK